MEAPKPPKLPENLRRLSAQEKLEIIYEANIRLFRGVVGANPYLVRDPNEFEVGYNHASE